MKIFFCTLIFGLMAIFFANFIADPFGLTHQGIEIFTKKNNAGCAVDKALIPEGSQTTFKKWLLSQSKAATIVVGSSRVMKIRDQDLNSSSFVNFGISALSLDSYLGMVDLIKNAPHVKNVWIGVEFYSFGNQTKITQIYDKIFSWARAWHLEPLAEHALIYFYSFKGSPAFQNKLSRFWNILTEYLSLPATRRTIASFLKNHSLEKKFYKILLPPNSFLKNKCLLSSTPEINAHGAWDAIDGSDYTREDLLGEPTKPDLSEYDAALMQGASKSAHWKLYDNISDISESKLKILKFFLSELKDRGVKVIGFTSPFPDQVNAAVSKIGLDPVVAKFENECRTIFQSYDSFFVLPTTASEIGCKDELNFIDPWHPDHSCMHKTVLRIRTQIKDLQRVNTDAF